MLPIEAEIVLAPALIPLARPVLDIPTAPGLEEFQFTELVRSLVLRSL